MAKAVRMADIAERLGVSVVTVSKALRGKEGVGDELRAQILRTAEELGYAVRPSGGASSRVIGILTPGRYLERGSSFYWSLYERLLTHLSASGDFGFLEVIGTEEEAACTVPRIVQDGRADGLIVMGALADEYLRMLGTLHVPFTMLDTYTLGLPIDTVISDGYFGMCTVTDYLLRQGHRKLMFIGTVGATSSITDRYYGFCRAMTGAGLRVTEDMVLPDRGSDGILHFTLPEDVLRRATALVCNCDYTAYEVLRQLGERGIRVPEDISVVGFDNYILSEMGSVKITTYAVNQDGMAAASVRQIRRRIADPQGKPEMHAVTGELIVRESVRGVGSAGG